jgi:phosphonate metabolism protein PhnN/1,5-bisphosphokinase (PRPP-forming)
MAELEDHDTLSEAEFAIRRDAGAFALDWQAHGLCYGLPASLIDDLALGRTVVVNTSRNVIGPARQRFPTCVVALVTARPEIRAERLSRRGRETAAEVSARLAREGAPLPPDISAETIDNSDSLESGVARFLKVLGAQVPA